MTCACDKTSGQCDCAPGSPTFSGSTLDAPLCLEQQFAAAELAYIRPLPPTLDGLTLSPGRFPSTSGAPSVPEAREALVSTIAMDELHLSPAAPLPLREAVEATLHDTRPPVAAGSQTPIVAPVFDRAASSRFAELNVAQRVSERPSRNPSAIFGMNQPPSPPPSSAVPTSAPRFTARGFRCGTDEIALGLLAPPEGLKIPASPFRARDSVQSELPAKPCGCRCQARAASPWASAPLSMSALRGAREEALPMASMEKFNAAPAVHGSPPPLEISVEATVHYAPPPRAADELSFDQVLSEPISREFGCGTDEAALGPMTAPESCGCRDSSPTERPPRRRQTPRPHGKMIPGGASYPGASDPISSIGQPFLPGVRVGVFGSTLSTLSGSSFPGAECESSKGAFPRTGTVHVPSTKESAALNAVWPYLDGAFLTLSMLDSTGHAEYHWNDDRQITGQPIGYHPAPRYWFGDWSNQRLSNVREHLTKAVDIVQSSRLQITRNNPPFFIPIDALYTAVPEGMPGFLGLTTPPTIYLHPPWDAADHDTQLQHLLAAIMELAGTTSPNTCNGPCDSLQTVEQFVRQGKNVGSRTTWAYVGFAFHRYLAREKCMLARVQEGGARCEAAEAGFARTGTVYVPSKKDEDVLDDVWPYLEGAFLTLSMLDSTGDGEYQWNDDRQAAGKIAGAHPAPSYWFGPWNDQHVSNVREHLTKAVDIVQGGRLQITRNNPPFFVPIGVLCTAVPERTLPGPWGLTTPPTVYLHPVWDAADHDTKLQHLLAAIMELTGTTNPNTCDGLCNSLQAVEKVVSQGKKVGSRTTWAFVGFAIHRYLARGTCIRTRKQGTFPGTTPAPGPGCHQSITLDGTLDIGAYGEAFQEAIEVLAIILPSVVSAYDTIRKIEEETYQEDQEAHWNDDRPTSTVWGITVEGTPGTGHPSPRYWFGPFSQERLRNVNRQLAFASSRLREGFPVHGYSHHYQAKPTAFYVVGGANPSISLFRPWFDADPATRRLQLLAAIMELTGTTNGNYCRGPCDSVHKVANAKNRASDAITWAYVGFIIDRAMARGTCALAKDPSRASGHTHAHPTECVSPPWPGGWDPARGSCHNSGEWTLVDHAYRDAYTWVYTALRYVKYALNADPVIARRMWTWDYTRKAKGAALLRHDENTRISIT